MSDVIALKPKSPDVSDKFIIGSTVRLKGGGAIMTVRKPGKQTIEVEWHNTSDDPISADYHPQMLIHADPDAEEDTKEVRD